MGKNDDAGFVVNEDELEEDGIYAPDTDIRECDDNIDKSDNGVLVEVTLTGWKSSIELATKAVNIPSPCKQTETILDVLASAIYINFAEYFPPALTQEIDLQVYQQKSVVNERLCESELRELLKSGLKLFATSLHLKPPSSSLLREIESISEPLPFYPAQRLVAEELFERTKHRIDGIENFKDFKFLILVPNSKTLKQQTFDRLMQIPGLVADESEALAKVIMYGGSLPKLKRDLKSSDVMDDDDDDDNNEQSALHGFSKITKELLSTPPSTLYLIVVDECHFAPTANAIPFIFDQRVLNMKNIVMLFVSATPFNLLSESSRFDRDETCGSLSVVNWRKVINEKGKEKDLKSADTYIGLEYYSKSLSNKDKYSQLVRVETTFTDRVSKNKKKKESSKEGTSWFQLLEVSSNVETQKPKADLKVHSLVADYIISICTFSILIANHELNEQCSSNLLSMLWDCTSCTTKSLSSSLLRDEMEFFLDKYVIGKCNNKPSFLLLLDWLKNKQKKLQHPTNNDTFTETDHIINFLLRYKVSNHNVPPLIILRTQLVDHAESIQRLLRYCVGQVCKISEKDGFAIAVDSGKSPFVKNIGQYHYLFMKDLHFSGVEKNEITAKAKITFEHLLGIPCLLIVVEKARMGDTFPHSLRVMDLRLRTAEYFTAFVQEIGRTFRYPKYTMDDGFQHICKSKEAFCGAFSNETFERQFPCGTFLFLDQQNLGLALSYDKLLSLLFPENHQLCNNEGQEEICFRFGKLLYPTPYILIHRSLHCNNLSKPGISDSEDCSSLGSLKCVKLDQYLISGMTQPFKYRLNQRMKHYDKNNSFRHRQRLLLEAECQIGKTGAYLAYLWKLKREIVGKNSDLLISPLPPIVQYSPNIKLIDWYMPYWESIQKQEKISYDFPKKGKYHKLLLQFRLSFYKLAEYYHRQNSSNRVSLVDLYFGYILKCYKVS